MASLISNAIDASQPNGTIVVRTEPSLNGDVVISVQDQGTGVPAEHFDKLYQESFTTKGSGGGGLILVHEMVINLGGKVLPTVSVADKGSVFSIAFPLVR